METVTSCPACQSVQREVELGSLVDDTFFSVSGTWTMMRCKGCQAAYLDPRPREAAIHIAYSSYYTHEPETKPKGWKAIAKHAVANSYRNQIFGTVLQPALPMGHLLARLSRGERKQQIEQSDRGLASLPEHGAVLDVGCGNGTFLLFARELGWKPYGVELDAQATQTASKAGINVLAGSLEELSGHYEGYFDAITLSHVIEHLHHPSRDLLRCFALLKPGGYIWIETPNIESVGFKLFGRYWRGIEAPRHLVLFNESSLSLILRRAGFDAIERRPMRDSAPSLYRRSMMIRAGYRPEDDPRKLTLSSRLQLLTAIYESRTQTARNPRCAEYLCMSAKKPTI
jgi:2-polyprenyl-3-methyl-5-hydroxy-6-metoxy-1,4-benzoquinol methylase